jgi:hypothetical protein
MEEVLKNFFFSNDQKTKLIFLKCTTNKSQWKIYENVNISVVVYNTTSCGGENAKSSVWLLGLYCDPFEGPVICIHLYNS